jgi:hypothetical protein
MTDRDKAVELLARALAEAAHESEWGNAIPEAATLYDQIAQLAVRVKPLVWFEESDRCWSAHWGFATYSVYLRDDGQYSMRMSWSLLMTDGYYGSLEAAKAAAQADYAARILSAVEAVDVSAAVAAETERCAGVAESLMTPVFKDGWSPREDAAAISTMISIAAAIRGKTEGER